MTILELLVLLVIAAICGGLGARLGGFDRAGCAGSLALGFIGALLGARLARLANLPEVFAIDVGGEITFPILWSIIGSALFVGLLTMMTGPRDRV